nr:hypothetical protein [Tanacetum cinerariifolium]
MSEQPPPPLDTTTTPQLNGTTTIPPPQTTTANPPKRHRRPSVRLGDIGYHHRRFPVKSSKTKQLIQDPFEYKDENTHWKPKKGTKRFKSNFGQHPFQYNHHNDNDNESLNFAMDDDENDINFDDDDDDGENEELKEIRVRVSDGAPSDNGLGLGLERNGVRVWLNQIGLGRYAHVFELHEVDDEVLPLLTLEDLKDMGINAVGSRRKMFCSIQKLGKGFS